MAQFISKLYSKRILFEIKESNIDDAVIKISPIAARKIRLYHADFAWVHHKKTRRPFELRLGNPVDENIVEISSAAQDNLNVHPGDRVYLYEAKLPLVQTITLYPLLGTAAAFEGRMVSDHIHPYFHRGLHPVYVNDLIQIGPATFSVVNIAETKFGLITPQTQIHLIKRMGAPHSTYDTIDDVVSCILELQRNVDYVSPTWCAESLAQFAKGLQRAVDLLQAPPVYEKAISYTL